MKLYTFSPAPSGKRVSVFLKLKNQTIETQEINVRDGEQFEEPFKSMNPFNCIPFLELNNGDIISESISICRYLEEEYFPAPNLFGNDATERAIIDMWNRRLEIDGLTPLYQATRNKTSFFVGRVIAGTRNDIEQSSQIAERGLEMINTLFERIDNHFEKNKYICANRFSIADITGFYIFKSCEILKFEIPKKFSNVLKWKKILYKNDCFDV